MRLAAASVAAALASLLPYETMALGVSFLALAVALVALRRTEPQAAESRERRKAQGERAEGLMAEIDGG